MLNYRRVHDVHVDSTVAFLCKHKTHRWNLWLYEQVHSFSATGHLPPNFFGLLLLKCQIPSRLLHCTLFFPGSAKKKRSIVVRNAKESFEAVSESPNFLRLAEKLLHMWFWGFASKFRGPKKTACSVKLIVIWPKETKSHQSASFGSIRFENSRHVWWPNCQGIILMVWKKEFWDAQIAWSGGSWWIQELGLQNINF